MAVRVDPIKAQRKAAREKMRSMPKWFRQMVKDLGLKPETVQFCFETPVQSIRESGQYASKIEHTGFVKITVTGWNK